MRILIQRVSRAQISIGGAIRSQIGPGMLILVGVEAHDGQDDVQWLASKAVSLRIFDDCEGVMNLDIVQTAGQVMIVSQFTLHASTRKGNRPSYIRAARPEQANALYENFIHAMQSAIGAEKVATGVFGADMQVELINDGPVTIWIDSRNRE